MRAFLLLLADLKTTDWREYLFLTIHLLLWEHGYSVNDTPPSSGIKNELLSVHGISHKHIFIYTFQLLFDWEFTTQSHHC